jgi:hypothetical protein
VRVASEDHAFVGGDGRAVPVSYVASPIFGARGITGAVLAFRDVLAVKRSERVQRLLANCSAALGESLDRGRTVVALARCIVPGFADTCSVDLLAAAGDPHPSSPSFITVELRVRERTLGVLRLGMTESGRTYSDADRRVAEEIAHRTAVALGAGLNAQTIPELAAKIVCGAANNQLATEQDGARLMARGITYAPDYVVNAGGIINVSAEYLGEPADVVENRVAAIAGRLMKVLEAAKTDGVPPHQAADRIARERIAAASKA